MRLAATGAPIARLKPTGSDDSKQVFYWYHRGKWSKTGPMGGAILPLDEALAFITSDPIFWIWTENFTLSPTCASAPFWAKLS